MLSEQERLKLFGEILGELHESKVAIDQKMKEIYESPTDFSSDFGSVFGSVFGSPEGSIAELLRKDESKIPAFIVRTGPQGLQYLTNRVLLEDILTQNSKREIAQIFIEELDKRLAKIAEKHEVEPELVGKLGELVIHEATKTEPPPELKDEVEAAKAAEDVAGSIEGLVGQIADETKEIVRETPSVTLRSVIFPDEEEPLDDPEEMEKFLSEYEREYMRSTWPVEKFISSWNSHFERLVSNAEKIDLKDIKNEDNEELVEEFNESLKALQSSTKILKRYYNYLTDEEKNKIVKNIEDKALKKTKKGKKASDPQDPRAKRGGTEKQRNITMLLNFKPTIKNPFKFTETEKYRNMKSHFLPEAAIEKLKLKKPESGAGLRDPGLKGLDLRLLVDIGSIFNGNDSEKLKESVKQRLEILLNNKKITKKLYHSIISKLD